MLKGKFALGLAIFVIFQWLIGVVLALLNQHSMPDSSVALYALAVGLGGGYPLLTGWSFTPEKDI